MQPHSSDASTRILDVQTARFLTPQTRRAISDRVLAGLILLITAPVLIGIAIAIALESRSSILTRSARLGRNGTTFGLWRFRTTRDLHLTRVGRLIDQCSLDELPQLFNVLAGTMSLVGPRPQHPEHAALPTAVKPGMFGTSRDIADDETWSVFGDLAAIFRNLRAVVVTS